MSGNVSKEARTSPPVRVSYPQVFNPRAFQAGQTPRYSIVIMINKNEPKEMDFMKLLYKDAQEALAEKWPKVETRPRTPLTGHDRSLFKDGDKALNNNGIPLAEKNPEYAGHYIIRASTTQKPAVVDNRVNAILDQNEIYGGCYCVVNCNVYTFVQPQNQGVTIGLNGVQKFKDGESFGGGRPPVEEMFGAFDMDSENPTNYD